MFSKIKTRLVLSFLGLAAKLSSKAETARGERIRALQVERLKAINETNRKLVNIDRFRVACNKALDEYAESVVDKAAGAHTASELAEMELASK